MQHVALAVATSRGLVDGRRNLGLWLGGLVVLDGCFHPLDPFLQGRGGEAEGIHVDQEVVPLGRPFLGIELAQLDAGHHGFDLEPGRLGLRLHDLEV